jgi:hypothetical protein
MVALEDLDACRCPTFYSETYFSMIPHNVSILESNILIASEGRPALPHLIFLDRCGKASIKTGPIHFGIPLPYLQSTFADIHIASSAFPIRMRRSDAICIFKCWFPAAAGVSAVLLMLLYTTYDEFLRPSLARESTFN